MADIFCCAYAFAGMLSEQFGTDLSVTVYLRGYAKAPLVDSLPVHERLAFMFAVVELCQQSEVKVLWLLITHVRQ